MSFIGRKIIVLILPLLVLACDGQNRPPLKSPKLLQAEAASKRMVNIQNPKNGFRGGLMDKQGNLWFISFGGGIYYFDGTTFTHFSLSNELCNNEINTIFEDKEGRIWLGTSKGLCRYDGTAFSQLPIPYQDTSSVWLDQVYPVINPNAVHAIEQDAKGNYWIGTGGGGAYYYDGEHFTSFLANEGMKYEDSLYHNWIPDIAKDKDGNIWFSSMSYGGLNCYDGKTFRQFLREDGLSDDMVRTVLEDRAGKLWIGFNGNRKSGLTVYDEGSFYTYFVEDGLCHKNIQAIYEDKQGKIWLGGEGGICIFDREKFVDFLDDKGQKFSPICFIIEDKHQNIWFGGRNGLWKFDGKEIIAMIQ